MSDKPYATFVLGKDKYTVNPFVDSITVNDSKPTVAGYEITYRLPIARLAEFWDDLTSEEKQQIKFRVKE